MADSPRGLSRTTLIIVVVCASLAGLAIVLLTVKLLRSRRRRPAAPLPPVQPLAHRRTTKFETYYDTPLLYNNSRPTSSIPPNTPDRLDTPLPVPIFPSSSDSFHSSDSGLPAPSRPTPPPRPLSSVSVISNGIPALSHRTSRQTLRGVPHNPHSRVQIILPAPLAPSLQRPQSRQCNSRRDIDSDRMSFVDKWVPVGRDDSSASNNASSPSTPRPSRRASSTTSMSTSPSSYSYFQPHSPPPPVPELPSLYPTPIPTEHRGPAAT
ncbi:hypothetical protein D9615_005210 [Tricholomella constricta]|uniref:Uncharacterized protein n=1 Tax=Tricholomella constricta TaxID=117010 RepID=A0A8H5H6T5_9AGAR|nr:hypothetical protein D9615_005210 [Tricholomella constricta]